MARFKIVWYTLALITISYIGIEIYNIYEIQEETTVIIEERLTEVYEDTISEHGGTMDIFDQCNLVKSLNLESMFQCDPVLPED
jgi:hypothetical protein